MTVSPSSPPNASRSDILRNNVESIVRDEHLFLDAVYQRWFATRPDTLELFGANDQAARYQMVRETLMYAIDHIDGANWVKPNSQALGHKHHDYGVTFEMYDDFLECMIETLAEFAGPQWTDELDRLWREALAAVSQFMRTAGAGAPQPVDSSR